MSLRPDVRPFPGFLQKLNLNQVPTWENLPARSAAVLMLFVQTDENCHLLLTRRSKHVTSHRGQIGFPGGMREPHDLSPADTALREYEEELGAPRKRVQILGCLKTERNIDGLLVLPVVGLTRDPGGFHPAESEVAQVFMPPTTDLQKHRVFEFNAFGQWRESDLFEGPTVPIWGLTARILRAAGFPEILF